jgi:hypothetical protein
MYVRIAHKDMQTILTNLTKRVTKSVLPAQQANTALKLEWLIAQTVPQENIVKFLVLHHQTRAMDVQLGTTAMT